MAAVGIRELRQNAGAVLRRVASGESIDITDRGRPVARIVPYSRHAEGIARLLAEGRATEPTQDLLDLEPLQPVPGAPSLSDVLSELRADER